MTRFLTTTAIGLLLGLAPALAGTQTATEPAAAVRNETVPAPSTPTPQSSDAAAPVTAASDASPFLTKQDSSELLAANLIGQPVLDADNESIGEVTDLITDKDGKIVALLIGAGGFLGIGEKDLAIRYRDITVTRDENDDLTIKADVTKAMVAQAPDYETLDEQQMIVGEKSDREDSSQ